MRQGMQFINKFSWSALSLFLLMFTSVSKDVDIPKAYLPNPNVKQAAQVQSHCICFLNITENP